MRNLAGSFSEVSAQSGADDTGFAQGVAVGDVNEDGFADVLVFSYGPNTLLINNGDETFADASYRMNESETQITCSTSGGFLCNNEPILRVLIPKGSKRLAGGIKNSLDARYFNRRLIAFIPSGCSSNWGKQTDGPSGRKHLHPYDEKL